VIKVLRGLERLDIDDLLRAPARQGESLRRTEHRPWPLPARGWLMGQTWDDLLFAHWRVDASVVRSHVPAGLELDTYDGAAWVGVTPFVVTGMRLRGTPPLPVVSTFRELNVRTYVTEGSKPGVWFFSLDASSTVAVEAARRTYHLPYFRARIEVEPQGGWLAYSCARAEGVRPHVFEGRYRPTGPAAEPGPGTLEHFLTERYCLYAEDSGRLHRAEIHHAPWSLQPAEAEIDLNTMPPDRLELPDEAPLLHFSRRQDVVIWQPERM
jgi:uncharacterized protein YqjF (DUF2071 family)